MAEAADFQGMTPSPARRWLRRTAGLLAAAPLLVGLMQLPSAPAAHAVNAEATGSRSVDVSVNELTPNVPTEDDTLTISGKVTNKTKQTVTDARVDLRVGPVMTGRTEIDNASKRVGTAQGLEGSPIGGKYVEKFDKLAPDVPQDFTLSIPVKELDLSSAGIYQLGVTLTGRTAAQPAYDQTLGIQRTFLPWQPEASEEKTKLTYMWPLISRVHMTAETGSDEQQTPVFTDDGLAEEIAPGGRLDTMLSLGSDLPVTWVIDPDLLASVDAMVKGYRIKNPDGSITPGKNNKLAKDWLNRLEQAVKDKKVVALPYADPDLASLAHNSEGSLGYLKDATDAAVSTVDTILHVTPSTDFSWPVDGAIDPKIVNVATSAGAHTVIARSDSLRETGNLLYTPSAARPIGGGTTAVVADARLSTAFQGDMSSAENSTLAVQEFLAQSQMITLQDPEKQRNIVVAPQRMPSTSQAQAMAAALGAPGADRWSQSDDLLAAAKAKPDPKATSQVPSSYPKALSRQELSEKAFTDIQTTKSMLDKFKVILSEPDRVVPPFGRAIDREMSTSWRGHKDEASAYRSGVQDWLDKLTSQVKLIPKTEVKLSGRSATIPVTIQNNLVQGVEHLTLRLTSAKPARLKIGDKAYDEEPVKVSAAHSQSIKFTTTANANGPVPVTAQLFTADGEPYGDPIPFDVNVTEVTPTVMLVIAGGVLLLVLAGFRMYTQRKAAARRAAEEADAGGEDGPEGESGSSSGEDDPEQPSDPTPDTAPESTDPSGTGERVDR
ncbi:DUF6049 family protein [Streptomyces sp. NBC_01304]|uniref:DUF6049 family protein n=1 Tax=Streptomyces sp. NBC_01304 TaxID=2903818 RepID=UPI002E1512D3|nr:DUF6049 family protein [Streptomyces sp. NBC_01304]